LKNGEFIHITHKSLTDKIFSDIAIQMSDDETDQYLTDNGLCYAKVNINIIIYLKYYLFIFYKFRYYFYLKFGFQLKYLLYNFL